MTSYEKLSERLVELDRELNPPPAEDKIRRFDLLLLFPDGIPILPVPVDHCIPSGHQSKEVVRETAIRDETDMDERVKKLAKHLRRPAGTKPVAPDSLAPTPSQIANLGGNDDD